MKKIISKYQLFGLILLCLGGVNFSSAVAQRADYAGRFGNSQEEGSHFITKLSADYIAGKVNVSWSSVNMKKDCIYRIERSKDSKNYQMIGTVKGFVTIGNYETFYSYTDNSPLGEYSYYRVTVYDGTLGNSDADNMVYNNNSIATETIETVASK